MAQTSFLHASGTIYGTGAEIEVKGDKCGFAPEKVRVTNTANGTTVEWWKGMADGHGLKTIGQGADKGTIAMVTTGGITPLAPAAAITAAVTPASKGFKIGTDALLNVNGALLVFEAIG